MFLRIKTFRNQDGSKRHYLYLVAAKRKGGCIRQHIIAHLGRIEEAEKNVPEIIKKLSEFRKKIKFFKK